MTADSALPAPATDPATEPDNLYATISLVAGLIGVFWVAIIFCTMAQKRPGGRLQALFGGVLGYGEVLVLVLTVIYRLAYNPV